MNELLGVLDKAEGWSSRPSIFVTTQPMLAPKLEKMGKTYVVGECNRNHPFEAVKIFFLGLSIMARDKPDVVVTTGSMPIAMICIAAKLFGKKVVWIDSIANTERFSVSGRLVYPFADLFLTQWPELAEKHRKAEYAGAIL
jgi:UDP-N-acetylglucosamine:LPS N-acetylglucosamine transferase